MGELIAAQLDKGATGFPLGYGGFDRVGVDVGEARLVDGGCEIPRALVGW